MTTMKAMDSFSFGTPMRAQYTSNKTWVVCGDEVDGAVHVPLNAIVFIGRINE